MHTALLAVLYTCAITGAVAWGIPVLVFAWVFLGACKDVEQWRRARRQAGVRVVAEAEALLREDAR